MLLDNGGSMECCEDDELMEENSQLKDQLELFKQSLAQQKEKSATNEMTMMDAILQMKQQISQVMTSTGQTSITKINQSKPQQRHSNPE